MTSPISTDRAARRPRERFQLGSDLCLDAGRLRLERNGSEIPLPKLSFDFLLALVRAAPNVVTYDDLMAQVWPGLVVQPETISQRAKLLRDALSDDPQTPKVVRGVRGRGYALACTVQSTICDDLNRPCRRPLQQCVGRPRGHQPRPEHRRIRLHSLERTRGPRVRRRIGSRHARGPRIRA